MTAHEENQRGDRKRHCYSNEYNILDTAMWDWFQSARSINIPLSGPLIQEKALEFAASLGIDEFKASNGWLNRFNKRHNLVCGKISGERGSVNDATVIEWKEKLPSIISGYQLHNIFNMDETGIFFRALPDKTMHERAKECTGGKRSKDRVTCLLCVNALGDFERTLIIGHSLNPRCFKNIPPFHLPVTYRANKKAWMTSALYHEWLNAFDAKMRNHNRHILLFLDNAPCHPPGNSLTNIKLIFLPANTTSVLQPLDQGIIQCLKLHYRKRLLRRVISQIYNGCGAETEARSVNILDACQWIAAAIEEIRPSTVHKCFSKCGLNLNFEEGDTPNNEDEEIETLKELLNIASDRNICVNVIIDPEAYVHIDSEIQVNDNLEGEWESRILENSLENETPEDLSDEDEPIEQPEIKKFTFIDALSCIANLKVFLKDQSMTDDLTMMSSLEDKVNAKAISTHFPGHQKQSNLDAYFD